MMLPTTAPSKAQACQEAQVSQSRQDGMRNGNNAPSAKTFRSTARPSAEMLMLAGFGRRTLLDLLDSLPLVFSRPAVLLIALFCHDRYIRTLA